MDEEKNKSQENEQKYPPLRHVPMDVSGYKINPDTFKKNHNNQEQDGVSSDAKKAIDGFEGVRVNQMRVEKADNPEAARKENLPTDSEFAAPEKKEMESLKDTRTQETIDQTNSKSQIQNANQKNATLDKPKRKSWKKWLFLGIAILILATIGYFGWRAWDAARKIITDNTSGSSPFLKFLDKTNAQELKGEGDGRINILLLGTATPGYPGADLSDTIMVVSVDPINKTVAMLSLPRDLYVKFPDGSSSKINAANAYGEMYHKSDGGGGAYAKETISQFLDLPIHYYIRMNFTGFKELVDEVGGVDVTVEKAINDPTYPNDRTFGYEPFKISAGPHHLDGATALKYVRSRHTSSDFDRARRQQQVLVALKEKAVTVGILLNPKKISDIMGIMKSNLQTDMQPFEIQRFSSLMQDVDTKNIASRVLDDTPEGLLKSEMLGDTYVLVPRDKTLSDVRDLAHEIFIEPYLGRENASISILNGTNKSGLATTAGKKLTSYGYHIISVGDLPDSEAILETSISDCSGGKKPFTMELLKKRLDVSSLSGDYCLATQNSNSGTGVDIVVVLGKDYTAK